MKIKKKKKLNLPQLIEWVEKNGIRNHVFISDIARNEVEINIHGCIFCKYITLKDTFTVEVEEEITEETHLDYLYALTNDDEKEIHRCMNFTIRNASMVIGRNDLTFFTLIDNDLVKIYENGKLVE